MLSERLENNLSYQDSAIPTNINIFLLNFKIFSLLVEEMKLFAKSLMKCKSYKERQNRLSESIDQLSFNYSEVCTLLYKEMKRREIESNNPYKMYFSFESSDCFVKLHEGLLLVKNNNIMAKDKYMEHLKNMLDQTIDHGVNIDKTLKICRLIEKSPHLKSIYK